MDHIGIDVHKRDSQIYLLAEGGEIVEPRIRTEPERFAAVLGTRPRARIVIEASTDRAGGGPVSRGLRPRGHRRGPELRADVCAADPQGEDRPTGCPGPGRGVPARRLPPGPSPLRPPAARYISLIRALLRQHGARVPSGSAESFIHRVRGLPLPGRLLSVVAPLLALMRPLNRQLSYSDATIEHLAVQDPRVPRLRSVPSVGPVTAAAFLAAIDDAQRFRHAHQLDADLGLVPREYSSGETQRRSAITKAGHSRTRWLLIQVAVSILRRRPPPAEALRTWALRIAARRGTPVAVVALARRLAGILYARLRDGRVFEPPRVRHPRPPAAALANM